MSNTFYTNSVAVPLIAEMEKNLDIISRLNIQFAKEAATAGNNGQVTVVLPGFGGAVVEGASLSGADLSYTGGSVTITVSQYRKGVQLGILEEQVKLMNEREQIIKPYAYDFASAMQKKVANNMFKAATHSTVIASYSKTSNGFDDLSDLITMINESRIGGETYGSLSHTAHNLVKKSGINQFNPVKQVGDMFTKGIIGEYDGVEFSANADITALETGTHADTGLSLSASVNANGAYQLSIAGAGANGTWKAGEIIYVHKGATTAPKVKNVDVLGAATQDAFSFVVQADATADGAGAVTLDVQPLYLKPATGSNPKQNLDVPALTSGWGVSTATKQNSTYVRGLVWKKSAYILNSFPINPVVTAENMGKAEGFSLQCLIQREGSVLNSTNLIAMDVVMGDGAARGNGVGAILFKV